MNSVPLIRGKPTFTVSHFRPQFPWFGGDLQTLRNTMASSKPDLPHSAASRLLLPTFDGSGDTLSAAINRPLDITNRPAVLLVHGMTGDETSHNVLASAAYFLGRNHAVIRLNLRNAGPTVGTCKHLYHAGRSEDLRSAIASLPDDLTANKLFLIGISLGGNLVLKTLAEGDGLAQVIGAATVCAPIDLRASQQRIMAPRNLLYHRHFLKYLVRDARRAFNDNREMDTTLDSIGTILEFDDKITAPNAGFSSAEDYYNQCSAAPMIPEINTPVLMISAASDPLIPAAMYLGCGWPENRPINLIIAPDGGHVGFHDVGHKTPWHDRMIGAFIDSLLRQ